eukprot:CAMPEP_0172430092 /NCGR_PEP_ID=MMETSP1064-20121228/53065_1 /TAXON_ID=202472 /ORGANISM="Aulacoseira subarctica , Strain CCAP 1002/5" /LENGTH=365 /DNA_ID=CAMNT_0013175919 /DNA_START=318 /DNA_END=1415 /DNA_ORIENTATION=-
MKIPYILASAYIIAVGSVMASYNDGSSADKAFFQVKFLSWSKKFNKSYGTSEERNHRMQIWLDNHAFIEKHNRQTPQPSYFLGHNQFSDLSHDEYLEFNKLKQYSSSFSDSIFVSDVQLLEPQVVRGKMIRGSAMLSDIPLSKNWVIDGAVTSVKNQKSCGSCWAFSAVGAIEGLAYLRSNKLVDLSVQEFVDCDRTDRGCFGGLMNNAFVYEEGIGGVCSWTDYPYFGRKHWLKGCEKHECDVVPSSDISGFVNVTQSDEGLMEALSIQPVSVAVDAAAPDFRFYSSGVMDKEDCYEKLDHGVLAVGYGTQGGKDYFLIKNSWGTTWGQDGYIMLARGEAFEPTGQCGLHLMSSRPVYNQTDLA